MLNIEDNARANASEISVNNNLVPRWDDEGFKAACKDVDRQLLILGQDSLARNLDINSICVAYITAAMRTVNNDIPEFEDAIDKAKYYDAANFYELNRNSETHSKVPVACKQGKFLTYNLLDGTKINCQCIGEPYVTQILDAIGAAPKRESGEVNQLAYEKAMKIAQDCTGTGNTFSYWEFVDRYERFKTNKIEGDKS